MHHVYCRYLEGNNCERGNMHRNRHSQTCNHVGRRWPRDFLDSLWILRLHSRVLSFHSLGARISKHLMIIRSVSVSLLAFIADVVVQPVTLAEHIVNGI